MTDGDITHQANTHWWKIEKKNNYITIEDGKCFQISNSNYHSPYVMSHRRMQQLQLVS